MNKCRNVVLGCQITGVYDVNRNEILPEDNFKLIEDWKESLQKHHIKGIIFHNNFSDATVLEHQSQDLEFIKIENDPKFNPNIYRYKIYTDYLKKHAFEIDALFVTDISDVVMVENPFEATYFKTNLEKIFCGDEPKKLENDWMQDHCSHLRQAVPNFSAFESKFKDHTLLNCGIIGGKTALIQEFIGRLWQLHEEYNADNTTAFTGDMGAFNYLARTQYDAFVAHGAPVNTVFKAYELLRDDCWFRHK